MLLLKQPGQTGIDSQTKTASYEISEVIQPSSPKHSTRFGNFVDNLATVQLQ